MSVPNLFYFFPRYFQVQAQRFQLGNDRVPKSVLDEVRELDDLLSRSMPKKKAETTADEKVTVSIDHHSHGISEIFRFMT